MTQTQTRGRRRPDQASVIMTQTQTRGRRRPDQASVIMTQTQTRGIITSACVVMTARPGRHAIGWAVRRSRCQALHVFLTLLLLPLTGAAVIKDLHGPQHSEILFASSGGGTHVYISGTDIGTAFAPPTVALGIGGHVKCKVQPFTSTNNRLHCIVSAQNAPAPTPEYRRNGKFVSLPLHLYHRGQLARCWHRWRQHLIEHPCGVRFDVGGTPRVLRVLTPTVESSGVLRVSGEGIDGGLRGAQRLAATLYRGAVPVLGACGEKDCQASSMGAEALGCYSRPDAGGDGVSGEAQKAQLANVFSDGARFGCVLDRLSGGMAGGYFNVSLTAITDEFHRGDAYLGFLTTRKIDVATGRRLRRFCLTRRRSHLRPHSPDGPGQTRPRASCG